MVCHELYPKVSVLNAKSMKKYPNFKHEKQFKIFFFLLFNHQKDGWRLTPIRAILPIKGIGLGTTTQQQRFASWVLA